ncbi:propionyl-CoA synthetase [Chelatococcus sambhunathii]|uniref:Propionyl-CoA synthetase n=1 Tax=Chelatococcus sambhunathii TaxID=363953 RepID=A0ABU1DG81_9HYPH|nr:propionyl-CoA synthetase [Chelatococcus sambhunathii]MDR4307137.1 propionyl-CoA synthetase [Chelatococcus sambhunathii]
MDAVQNAREAYDAIHAASLADPETFWLKAAEAIDWFERPTRAFDASLGVYGRWFPDGVVNACHNALDRHVAAGRGEQTALIYDSPVTGVKRTYSFEELTHEVSRFAAVLQDFGVGKGDRVVVYMPMVPEAVIGVYACARLGAIHSVVFGGFSAAELAKRIDDAEPKLILTASCGIEPSRKVAYKPLLDRAIEMSTHAPEAVVLLQRPELPAELVERRDHDWESLRDAAMGRTTECARMAATDPLYILYTSGTTGTPKGVVRDTGGYLVALAWTMSGLYDIKPGEVFWCASDIGWVVGHSYIIYGPLLIGATTVLYEGKPVGTPDAGAFWRVIEEYRCVSLFTAPTAFRAIRKEDPNAEKLKNYDLTGFRALFLAGERADPATLQWAEEKLGVPVIDHCWQTETGWAIVGNPLGVGLLPVKHGSPTLPMPGYDLKVLDDEGHDAPAGKLGNIVIKLPLPPGCLPTLWNDEKRFRESYLEGFPGYYQTSDAGFVDEDGYVFFMARTDDIINVAGHRLSTGGMEEAIASHPDVAECAVVGVADAMKGQTPVGFVVLKAGVDRPAAELEREIVQVVRDRVGPVAAFKTALTVARLPKTRSGKILRGTIQKIADGEDWTMPATIEDPTALDEIGEALKARG